MICAHCLRRGHKQPAVTVVAGWAVPRPPGNPADIPPWPSADAQ